MSPGDPVVCPSCGARYRLSAPRRNRRYRCTACRAIFMLADEHAPASVEGPPTDRPPGAPAGESPAPAGDPDKYAVKEEIARGGMGAILRAADRDIGRDVAMKVMLDALDESSRARFIEEARLTGRLEHPNIVPVHELGVDAQGRLYFTMKLVRGRSLGEILHDKDAEVPPPGRLLNAFTGACNAVAFAHARGVIHRDLKPANIMLGDFGEVLVMDWGLAKAVGSPESRPAGAAPPLDPSPERTLEGAVLGTPQYMSPEQARGELATPRSDVYSLGAILYEILTLAPPVQGPTVATILRSVAQGDIQPPERRAPGRSIPPELSAIALRAMARDPGLRYGSVDLLRKDVERYQEGRSVSAKEDSAWESLVKFVRRNRAASAATAVAVVVVAALLATGYSLNLQERRRAEQALKDFRAEQSRRRADQRKVAPAVVQAARLAIDARRWDAALLNLEAALINDPELAEARFLKAAVGAARGDHARAAEEFGAIPADPDAAALRDQCRILARGGPEAKRASQALAEILMRRQEFALAAPHLSAMGDLARAYREILSKAMPRWADEDLELRPDGSLELQLGSRGLRDLAPLSGLLISHLTLDFNPLTDLNPLRNLPLRTLSLAGCEALKDLSPLAGLRLESLDLNACKSLEDLGPLRGLPLKWLVVKDTAVSNLGPLKGLPLETLDASNIHASDLAPLEGMPLRHLHLYHVPTRNLLPLKGMPLETLSIGFTAVSDLSPIVGAPLSTLVIWEAPVSNLLLLKGMKLEDLRFTIRRDTRGLDILRAMKSLRTLGTWNSGVMAPQEFWKLYDAGKIKQ